MPPITEAVALPLARLNDRISSPAGDINSLHAPQISSTIKIRRPGQVCLDTSQGLVGDGPNLSPMV
jgi:hypothetical protein